MKKILSLLFLLFSISNAFGKNIDVTTAKTVGYNFLSQHGAKLISENDDLHLVYTHNGSDPTLYVFGGTNCYVVVSADDAVMPVLGYSLSIEFNSKNIPDGLKYMFDWYN